MALGGVGVGLLWAAIDNFAQSDVLRSDAGAFAFRVILRSPAQVFSSVPGRFSVAAPVDLAESSHTVDAATEQLRMFIYSGESTAALYAVTYVDYPAAILKADPQRVLSAAAHESFGGSAHDLVLSEKPLLVDGRPGRDIVARMRLDGARAVASARFVLAGTRLYELEVIEPQTKYRKARAEHFFDSFTIRER